MKFYIHIPKIRFSLIYGIWFQIFYRKKRAYTFIPFNCSCRKSISTNFHNAITESRSFYFCRFHHFNRHGNHPFTAGLILFYDRMNFHQSQTVSSFWSLCRFKYDNVPFIHRIHSIRPCKWQTLQLINSSRIKINTFNGHKTSCIFYRKIGLSFISAFIFRIFRVITAIHTIETYRCIITSSHNIEFHIYIILLYTENIIKSIGFQIIYRNKRKRFGIIDRCSLYIILATDHQIFNKIKTICHNSGLCCRNSGHNDYSCQKESKSFHNTTFYK